MFCLSRERRKAAVLGPEWTIRYVPKSRPMHAPPRTCDSAETSARSLGSKKGMKCLFHRRKTLLHLYDVGFLFLSRQNPKGEFGSDEIVMEPRFAGPELVGDLVMRLV